jgi:hypothetical protein
MRHPFILACALALLPGFASADDVLLKGGGRISGRILSRTDTSVQVDVGVGIITVSMANVASIEERRSILDDYQERASAVRPDDVPGWLQLARWSQSEGLRTQARRIYERVLTLDPQNVEANQALGNVLVEGRWVSEQESYRARGYVQFEGAWITPAERDAIVDERDARFNELRLLDAERRARDAELRAADAELRAQQAALSVGAGVAGIPLWWGSGYVTPGYSGNYRYGRRPHGKPGGPGWNPWPQMGTFPSSPLGVFPSYPIGPSGSFPIGPAGSFPIGPSPPGSIGPSVGTGRPPGVSRPPSGAPPARPTPSGGRGQGRPSSRP